MVAGLEPIHLRKVRRSLKGRPEGKRILALVTEAWGGGGGIAQYNRDLLEGLAEKGTRVDVVTLKSDHDEGTLPGGVTQLSSAGSRGHFARQAFKRARRGGYDWMFCGHLHLAPLAVVLGRLTHTPVWLQVHGIEAWAPPGRFRRWSADHCAMVTAVSRFTRRRLLSWCAIAPERVKVLPNTVEQRFTPGPKPEYLLDRYSLRGKRIVLTVGRLSAQERYKGHDKVIAAIACLLPQNPDIVYLVCGSGDDRSRLERLAKDLGISDNVQFLGEVASGELRDHYRLADLFAMPSTGEGFGIVFLEAMACGVPVLAASSGGSVDPLRDGTSGGLVSPGASPSEVAEAILVILDRDLRNEPAPDYFDRRSFSRRCGLLMSQLSKGFQESNSASAAKEAA